MRSAPVCPPDTILRITIGIQESGMRAREAGEESELNDQGLERYIRPVRYISSYTLIGTGRFLRQGGLWQRRYLTYMSRVMLLRSPVPDQFPVPVDFPDAVEGDLTH